MPDIDLDTAEGPTRVHELLHDAQPVLLNFGEPNAFDIGPWADRVQPVDATYDGVWDLPLIGEIDAPAAVLIRPDDYVAWTGTHTDPELTSALSRWFGQGQKVRCAAPDTDGAVREWERHTRSRAGSSPRRRARGGLRLGGSGRTLESTAAHPIPPPCGAQRLVGSFRAVGREVLQRR